MKNSLFDLNNFDVETNFITTIKILSVWRNHWPVLPKANVVSKRLSSILARVNSILITSCMDYGMFQGKNNQSEERKSQ